MLDAVARQNYDWTIVRQSAIEQRLGNAASVFQRARIGERSPRLPTDSIGQENAIGHDPRPMFETLGNLRRVRSKWMR